MFACQNSRPEIAPDNDCSGKTYIERFYEFPCWLLNREQIPLLRLFHPRAGTVVGLGDSIGCVLVRRFVSVPTWRNFLAFSVSKTLESNSLVSFLVDCEVVEITKNVKSTKFLR